MYIQQLQSIDNDMFPESSYIFYIYSVSSRALQSPYLQLVTLNSIRNHCTVPVTVTVIVQIQRGNGSSHARPDDRG